MSFCWFTVKQKGDTMNQHERFDMYLLATKLFQTDALREASFNRKEAFVLQEAGAKSPEDFLQCYDKSYIQAAEEVCKGLEDTAPMVKLIVLLLLSNRAAALTWATEVIEAKDAYADAI